MQSKRTASRPFGSLVSRAGVRLPAVTSALVLALILPASTAAGFGLRSEQQTVPRGHDFAGVQGRQSTDFDGVSRLRRLDPILFDLDPGTDLKGQRVQFWFLTGVHTDDPATRIKGRNGTANVVVDCFGTSNGVFQANEVVNSDIVFNSAGSAPFSSSMTVNVPCDRVQFQVETGGNQRAIGTGTRVHRAGVAPRPTSCPADPAALCLQGGRFQVTTQWATNRAQGDGFGVPTGNSEGTFYFFDPDNTELVIKMLNGCGSNNHFWVFAGGLTNVQFDLTVTDTDSNATMAYHNALNTPFQPVLDTEAFATCP